MLKIQKNISLARYTTFKIGGLAKFFLKVKTIEELKEGISFAKQNLIPFFILGGGSNLLVSDIGFNGLIIKIEIEDIQFEFTNNTTKVISGAGVVWDNLVAETVKRNLIGLENLSLIPGTVGASVVQNIGAFGREVKDFLDEVEVFDTETFNRKRLSKELCCLGYRDSFFKTKQGSNLIVTKVVFSLKNNNKLDYTYSGIKEKLPDKNIKVGDVREAIIQIRKERYPSIDECGSAGCFFKNPIISKDEFKELIKIFPEVPFYDLPDGKIKVLVAWLIEKFGWKGYQSNDVGVHKKHSLILVNHGQGTATEIKTLAEKISNDIFKKTNLKISNEVVFLE